MKRAVLLAMLLFNAAADWPGGTDDSAPWTTTDIGVSVQDVSVGAGELVVERSGVEVHYVGMLADGTVFDTSRSRDAPLDFRLGAGTVIRGWEDGLLGMRVGGVRRLVIPSDLAYGDQEVGKIPAGSVLYFEVEMLSVELPRVAPVAPAEVAPDAWRTVDDAVAVADVTVGDGKRVKVRKGERVCLDYAVFDAFGAVQEHTYDRDRCTWYRLGIEDLPAAVETGIAGTRAGARRLVRGTDLVWEVSIEAIGI